MCRAVQFECRVDVSSISHGQRVYQRKGSVNIKSGQILKGFKKTCVKGREVRYRGREVGYGRSARQPGQIRKEAAVTSLPRVVVQPLTLFIEL